MNRPYLRAVTTGIIFKRVPPVCLRDPRADRRRGSEELWEPPARINGKVHSFYCGNAPIGPPLIATLPFAKQLGTNVPGRILLGET